MKSALFVLGGWPGHEPKKCVDIFAPWLEEQGYDVEVSVPLNSYLDEAKMRGLSLIVPVWTQGTITKEQEKGLLEAMHTFHTASDTRRTVEFRSTRRQPEPLSLGLLHGRIDH